MSGTEPAETDFMSGTHGQVTGLRLTTSAIVGDALDDAIDRGRLQGMRLRRASATLPRRKVLQYDARRHRCPHRLTGMAFQRALETR